MRPESQFPENNTAPSIARVVVDAPIAQPLDYSLPAILMQQAQQGAASYVGRCCVVPLGRRSVIGVVVDVSNATQIDPQKLRSVQQIVEDIAPLSNAWRALTVFAAEYYQHAWGEVAVPALPPLLRTPPGPRFLNSLARLRATDFVENAAVENNATFALNAEQRAAAVAIASAHGFAPFVLFGVTGSGKTEVYLDAIAQRLANDAHTQALVLVPEINLTPQFEARLRARFPGVAIVSLHSGLAAAQRNAAWLAAHEGRARIVLGTRLAVFASLPALRLIVVDEEHDASFKAGDGVRYSARDLAVKRAQLDDVPIVLGSATPALETWSAAQRGKYTLLRLPQRAGAHAREQVVLPALQCVDVRNDKPQFGLTNTLRGAVADTVARGEQALLFINRRGYAPVVACDACGWLSNCPQCASFAAFHKSDGRLHCHHCGWQQPVPRACPTCGNQALATVGHGTQRVEEALRELLPQARVARIDRDSTRRKNSAQQAFDAVHAGDVDVLVGTQMIAKGHDFRRVTLVGILNADAQLVAPDFRAPERLFATLLQVAGRAGRSGLPSRVLLQTRYPDHPLYAALARADYEGFAQVQLREREAAAMPPYVHQALLTAEAKTQAAAMTLLNAAQQLAQTINSDVHVYDPVPMALERLAGQHRAQLLVEHAHRPSLQRFLAQWLEQLRAHAKEHKVRTRWQIEVDPQSI